MKRSIIVFATLILLGTAVFFIIFRGSNKKYDFRLDKVSQGDITMYVTATGTINPVISVEVGTQVSGIISKLYADFNSIVKEGQVIAQIDPTFLQQTVKDASANLERAEAQYADAKRVLERTKALYEKNLESQVNYDAALTQFLIEALVLSLLGGIIGILLGVAGSTAISSFAKWPTIITASSIILSFGFSIAIGIFFGFYPARKAALLNPIDALRYE